MLEDDHLHSVVMDWTVAANYLLMEVRLVPLTEMLVA